MIHDVQEGSEVVLCRIITVNAIVDCDKSDSLLRKLYFGIETDLKVVSAESAHVLDDDRSNMTGLNLSDQLIKARAVEGGSAVTIIGCCIVRTNNFTLYMIRGAGSPLAP